MRLAERKLAVTPTDSLYSRRRRAVEAFLLIFRNERHGTTHTVLHAA